MSPKSYLRSITRKYKYPKIGRVKKSRIRKSRSIVPSSPGMVMRKGTNAFSHNAIARGRVC